MLEQDRKIVQGLVISTTVGAFLGMALVGWLMFFDVSSIGTMVQSATSNSVFSTFVIGGSLLKGGLFCFAVGLATAFRKQRKAARGQTSFVTSTANA